MLQTGPWVYAPGQSILSVRGWGGVGEGVDLSMTDEYAVAEVAFSALDKIKTREGIQ